MDMKVELESICQSFVCPKSGEKYILLGVVEYRGIPVLRRSITSVGHYLQLQKEASIG